MLESSVNQRAVDRTEDVECNPVVHQRIPKALMRELRRVSLAYSVDSDWRNRDRFLSGRGLIREFLTNKWEHELDGLLLLRITRCEVNAEDICRLLMGLKGQSILYPNSFSLDPLCEPAPSLSVKEHSMFSLAVLLACHLKHSSVV
jgi:hypothetical protein